VSDRWVEVAGRGPLVFEPATRVHVKAGRPAVFLDRDGVLNELVPDPASGHPESPLEVGDVRLIAGAAAAVRDFAAAGFAIVCVSNQPAAAKGKASLSQLRAVHERLIELLAQQRAWIDASRLCPHHPDGVTPSLARLCGCRKPQPSMLLDAAAVLDLDLERSWMIGDTDADVSAGRSAGCMAALLEYPGSAHKRSGAASADLLATDLARAVPQLLSEPSRVRSPR